MRLQIVIYLQKNGPRSSNFVNFEKCCLASNSKICIFQLPTFKFGIWCKIFLQIRRLLQDISDNPSIILIKYWIKKYVVSLI